MSEYIEYTDDDERRRARDLEIVNRRRLAKRKQIIKRLIVLIVLCLIVIGLVIFGIVKGIQAIIHHFSGDAGDDKKPDKVAEKVIDDVPGTEGYVGTESGEITGSATDGGTNNGYGSPEGYGENKNDTSVISDKPDNTMTNPAGNYVIGENKVFEGYKVQKTDSTYYYTSDEVQSTYAILIDATNGQAICQKDGFVRINPASMTKIMTVLVAAEHLTEDDLKKQVTITVEDTDYCYKHDLSAVGFDIGEVVTVEDLFYGTILPSGADAAIALARYVAGDEATFIDMMNDKLSELGLSGTTHFTNCVGLFDDNHYSTCADMAMILKAAMENEYCCKVLSEHKYTTSLTTEHPEGILISNWFLRRIEDKDTNGLVVGAKTGFVNQSGSCAASYAVQNNGKGYFCVTAQAHSAWRCIYDQVDIYYNCAK